MKKTDFALVCIALVVVVFGINKIYERNHIKSFVPAIVSSTGIKG